MASESSSSNVLLRGQSAYTKKTGSMIDNGILDKTTLNSSNTYSGYIREGSKIRKANVQATTEYIQCENNMRSNLSSNFIETDEQLSIINTCNNIHNILDNKCERIQSIMDNMRMYKPGNCKILEEISTDIELTFPNECNLNINLQPDSNNIDYDILVDSNNNFKIHYENNILKINNIEISSNINIKRINNIFYINNFGIEINNVSNLLFLFPDNKKGFTGNFKKIHIYNDDTIHKIIPIYKCKEGSGLYDEQNMTFYKLPISIFQIYEKANIWSRPLYTDVYMTEKSGVEVKFANYSSNTSDYYIFGVGGDCVISGKMCFGLRKMNGKYCYIRKADSYSHSEINLSSNTNSSQIVTVSMNKNNDNKIIFSGAINGNYTMSSITTKCKSLAPFGFPGLCNDVDKEKYLRPNDTYFYYVKIYENGEIIRDLHPCKDVNGNYFMYDYINGYLYPKGNASFSTSGNMIEWR